MNALRLNELGGCLHAAVLQKTAAHMHGAHGAHGAHAYAFSL